MLETLLQDLVGRAQGIQERTEGIAFLKVSLSVYPLSTTVYLGLNIPLGDSANRFVQCTYSEAWAKQCVSREPMGVERLRGLAPILEAPLDWSELSGTSEAEGLLDDGKHLLGNRQVLSIPLKSIIGETAVLFLAGAMAPEEWSDKKPAILREFQVLGSYFHQHILRIYGHDASRQILISARELDCLKWMAAGKTAWEASVILGISERTVRFHLNAAREKLNCITTTQAVAKAVAQQLIES